jgi:hypothetical protein
LYDITPFLTAYANNQEIEQSKQKLRVRPKTEAARKAHSAKLLDNVDKVFEYAIQAQHGEGSFMLARASMHMRDEHFSVQEYEMCMNYINSMWESPMNEARFQKIINQYKHQMVQE